MITTIVRCEDNVYTFLEIDSPFSYQYGEIVPSDLLVPTKNTFTSDIVNILPTTDSIGVLYISNSATSVIPLRVATMYSVDYYVCDAVSYNNGIRINPYNDPDYVTAGYYITSFMIIQLYVPLSQTSVTPGQNQMAFIVKPADSKSQNLTINITDLTIKYSGNNCIFQYTHIVHDYQWQIYDYMTIYPTRKPVLPGYASLTVFYTTRYGGMKNISSDMVGIV